MSREWQSTKYMPERPTEYAARMIKAHRLCAQRTTDPKRAAGHRIAASILAGQLPDGAPAPSDDYQARVAAYHAIGGDWTPFSKPKDVSK
jgi:hypothetical protein